MVAVFLVHATQQPGAQKPGARTIGARVYQFYRGGYMPKWFMVSINEFGQSRTFTSFLVFKGGAEVARAQNEATKYYEQQLPIFLEAAKSFHVTPAIATVAKFTPQPAVATWYGMVAARARAYAQNKKERSCSRCLLLLIPLLACLSPSHLIPSLCRPRLG